MNALASPDEAILCPSGKVLNEPPYLYPLFVRQFGTNNLPNCSSLCHKSSGAAMRPTIGLGKGSVTLNKMYEAEVFLIIGQNPRTNHPRLLRALQKATKNEAKIINVNPLHQASLPHWGNARRHAHSDQPAGSGASLDCLA